MLQVGFNYPQYANYYGRWIGPCPGIDPKGSQLNPIWSSSLPVNLARLARMKVRVVRMFIMGNCLNYGQAPLFQTYDPSFTLVTPMQTLGVWHFNPPEYLDDPAYTHDADGKTRKFSDHYTRLLQCFKDAGLKLIPSVVDFQAFIDPFPGEFHPGWNLARGRADIVENADARSKFFTHILKKFIELSIPYKDQILAIEVINEPQWNIRSVKPPDVNPQFGNRIISEPIMIEFLAQACDLIEQAGLDSTVGHRFYQDCLQLPTGTLAQFHYYPPPNYLENLSGITIEPLLIRPLVTTQPAVIAQRSVASVFNPDPLVIPDHDSALREIQAAQLKVRPGWRYKVKEVFVGG